jgi:uncharacterized membrane protein
MDFTKRSNWTVRLLYLQIAVSVIAIITGTLEHGVLRDMQDGIFASEAEMMQVAEANDGRQAIVGILQLLIFLGSGIWILRWIHVACANARDLAERCCCRAECAFCCAADWFGDDGWFVTHRPRQSSRHS